MRDPLKYTSTDIWELKDEIAKLQDYLFELQAKRASAQKFADEHAVAPMHDLPTELLVKIFTYTLPRYSSFHDPREAPLLLDQVCGL